jgi:cell division protein FtsQ
MNWRPAQKNVANTKKARAQRDSEQVGAETGEPAQRVAWGWLIAKFLVGAAVVLGAAAAIALGAHHFLVTSSRFAVVRVEATGSRKFTEEQLLSMAGSQRGANLFALDAEAAERLLTASPWLQTARVSRKLPGTVVIRVTEHVAVALAALDGTLYLVARDGHPIKALEPGEEADFPIITGLGASDINTDRARAIELLGKALGVQREYERLPLSKTYPTEEIHLTADGKIDLVVGAKGMTLHLGAGPFRQKLLMASRVVGNLRARGQVPAVVFLDNEAHPERVVARMR